MVAQLAGRVETSWLAFTHDCWCYRLARRWRPGIEGEIEAVGSSRRMVSEGVPIYVMIAVWVVMESISFEI